jgi:hypothetical protein
MEVGMKNKSKAVKEALDILDGEIESSVADRIAACELLYKMGAHFWLEGRYGRTMKMYGVL